MDAVTLAHVKAWMNTPAADTSADARLNQLIPAVSLSIERFLGRELEKVERTEVYRLSKLRNRSLSLHQAPVDTTAEFEIKVSDEADWDDTDAMEAEDYLVRAGPGVVDFLPHRCAILGPTYVQVRYTAGYAATAADLITAQPDIAQAATLWVVEVWKRRESLGKTGQQAPGGAGVTWVAELGIPKIVRSLLEPYRRVRLRAA